jgi:hypothetical protein
MKKDQLSRLGFKIGVPNLIKSGEFTIKEGPSIENHQPVRKGGLYSARDLLEGQINKGLVTTNFDFDLVRISPHASEEDEKEKVYEKKKAKADEKFKKESKKKYSIEEMSNMHGESEHGQEMEMADIDYQPEEVDREFYDEKKYGIDFKSLNQEELFLKAIGKKAETSKKKKDDEKEIKKQKKDSKDLVSKALESLIGMSKKSFATDLVDAARENSDGKKKYQEKIHKDKSCKKSEAELDKSYDAQPTSPYKFVKSLGRGGIIFDFGPKTGNPMADAATELLNRNADSFQIAIAKHQNSTYQKALDTFVANGESAFKMADTLQGSVLNKGFDQQVKEAFENGTLYEDLSAPAIKNEFNKSTLKVAGEEIKATSETDAALIEMMKDQFGDSLNNDGDSIIDATLGGKIPVTVG